MVSERLTSVRGLLVGVLALLGGTVLGWVVVSGHRHLLELVGGVLGLVAVLSIPLGFLTQAFAFVSQAFPKAGKLEHGIPIDVGVVLSVILLAKWGLTAVLQPDSLVRRSAGWLTTLLPIWLVWVAFAFLDGVIHHSRLSPLVVEGSALGAAPLVGYWFTQLPEGLARRALAIARVALIFIVCFVFVQKLLHGHHTAISGLTVEAGGVSGYAAIYDRNNATNVGLKMVATYQNGNLLGAYLALASPLVMLIRSPRWRVLAFAGCLGAAILTLSRGTWFSVMAGFFFLAVLSREDRWPAFAIIGVSPIVALSTVFLKRLGHAFSTLSGRTPAYHALWIAMTHHLTVGGFASWIVGWGMGGGPGGITSEDSSLLWMFLCTGLIGLLLYGAMVWAVGQEALRTRVGRILFAGMLGTMVFELIDGQLFYVPTAWNFWMFAGLAVAFGRMAMTSQAQRQEEAGSPGAGAGTHPGSAG